MQASIWITDSSIEWANAGRSALKIVENLNNLREIRDRLGSVVIRVPSQINKPTKNARVLSPGFEYRQSVYN